MIRAKRAKHLFLHLFQGTRGGEGGRERVKGCARGLIQVYPINGQKLKTKEKAYYNFVFWHDFMVYPRFQSDLHDNITFQFFIFIYFN